MAKIQKVVRTAPTSESLWYDGSKMSYLKGLLEEGYHVVMCNPIGKDLEYIVEKEVDEGDITLPHFFFNLFSKLEI